MDISCQDPTEESVASSTIKPEYAITFENCFKLDVERNITSVSFKVKDNVRHPALVVNDVGRLAFPLLKSQALDLVDAFKSKHKSASPSHSWSTNSVTLGPDWIVKYVNKWAQQIGEKLLESSSGDIVITNRLDRLLFFESGGKEHHQINLAKSSEVFGGLLMQLPAHHTGGDLLIQNGKKRDRHPFSENSSDEIYCTAFHAGSTVWVEQISAGYKLMLLFQLINENHSKVPVKVVRQLVEATHAWMSAKKPLRKLVYPLQHTYSVQNMRSGQLTGKDKLLLDILLLIRDSGQDNDPSAAVTSTSDRLLFLVINQACFVLVEKTVSVEEEEEVITGEEEEVERDVSARMTHTHQCTVTKVLPCPSMPWIGEEDGTMALHEAEYLGDFSKLLLHAHPGDQAVGSSSSSGKGEGEGDSGGVADKLVEGVYCLCVWPADSSLAVAFQFSGFDSMLAILEQEAWEGASQHVSDLVSRLIDAFSSCELTHRLHTALLTGDFVGRLLSLCCLPGQAELLLCACIRKAVPCEKPEALSQAIVKFGWAQLEPFLLVYVGAFGKKYFLEIISLCDSLWIILSDSTVTDSGGDSSLASSSLLPRTQDVVNALLTKLFLTVTTMHPFADNSVLTPIMTRLAKLADYQPLVQHWRSCLTKVPPQQLMDMVNFLARQATGLQSQDNFISELWLASIQGVIECMLTAADVKDSVLEKLLLESALAKAGGFGCIRLDVTGTTFQKAVKLIHQVAGHVSVDVARAVLKRFALNLLKENAIKQISCKLLVQSMNLLMNSKDEELTEFAKKLAMECSVAHVAWSTLVPLLHSVVGHSGFCTAEVTAILAENVVAAIEDRHVVIDRVKSTVDVLKLLMLIKPPLPSLLARAATALSKRGGLLQTVLLCSEVCKDLTFNPLSPFKVVVQARITQCEKIVNSTVVDWAMPYARVPEYPDVETQLRSNLEDFTVWTARISDARKFASFMNARTGLPNDFTVKECRAEGGGKQSRVLVSKTKTWHDSQMIAAKKELPVLRAYLRASPSTGTDTDCTKAIPHRDRDPLAVPRSSSAASSLSSSSSSSSGMPWCIPLAPPPPPPDPVAAMMMIDLTGESESVSTKTHTTMSVKRERDALLDDDRESCRDRDRDSEGDRCRDSHISRDRDMTQHINKRASLAEQRISSSATTTTTTSSSNVSDSQVMVFDETHDESSLSQRALIAPLPLPLYWQPASPPAASASASAVATVVIDENTRSTSALNQHQMQQQQLYRHASKLRTELTHIDSKGIN